MKPKFNNKKLFEAVEGFQNGITLSLKESFSSLDEAETKSYSESENIRIVLRSSLIPKISSDEIINLNDFGKIDVDKSKFHSLQELSNAKMVLGSYAEQTRSGRYQAKICLIYRDSEFTNCILKEGIEGYIPGYNSLKINNKITRSKKC